MSLNWLEANYQEQIAFDEEYKNRTFENYRLKGALGYLVFYRKPYNDASLNYIRSDDWLSVVNMLRIRGNIVEDIMNLDKPHWQQDGYEIGDSGRFVHWDIDEQTTT